MSFAALAPAPSLPSTSGRCMHSNELRCSSAAVFGGSRLQLTSRHMQRVQARSTSGVVAMAAAFGRNKGAWKKYMSRQDLEVAYFKEWEDTTILAEQEGRRKMTPLTMLAFLPTFIKFYLVPGPVRYVWFLIWSVLQEAGYQLRKRAVVAAAKLDVATLQRRGIRSGYELRRTALRRLHGKDSLLSPLTFALGGRLA